MDDLWCWLAFVFAALLIFHETVFSASLNQLLSVFKAFFNVPGTPLSLVGKDEHLFNVCR